MVDMIQINDLKFSYPDGSAALRGVSLSVKPGEFVTLCGLSGCGKSTLLRLMKPGLFPRGELSGDVRFLGRKLTSEPDRDAAAKIGFVMQDPEAQTVTDKVWHELAFSCESVGMERSEIRRRVGEMAGYFGLEELFEKLLKSEVPRHFADPAAYLAPLHSHALAGKRQFVPHLVGDGLSLGILHYKSNFRGGVPVRLAGQLSAEEPHVSGKLPARKKPRLHQPKQR